MSDLGYTKNLFILPFDHRGSFEKEFEKETIASLKYIIYEAFKKAVSETIPKENAAILVDEEYGDAVLRDAKNQGYTIILTTEKSGEKEFAFEYGNEFGKHIEKYQPAFVKALIRYTPNANWDKLKFLSDYCRNNNYKFLLEVLLNSQNALLAIDDLHKKGIEPDVWKLEGMETTKDYENVVEKIQEENRQDVGLVILGRGENEDVVKKWLETGATVKGVIGFAVGRTIFFEPLKKFRDGKINNEQTIEMIKEKFVYFYNIFTK